MHYKEAASLRRNLSDEKYFSSQSKICDKIFQSSYEKGKRLYQRRNQIWMSYFVSIIDETERRKSNFIANRDDCI